MVPPHKLKELIQHSIEELPYDKQQEVYDFVEYLKAKNKKKVLQNTTDLRSLVGIFDGPADMAENHDEIYD